MNCRKTAVVSMMAVLILSMSIASVSAAQYDQYPPYEFGATNTYHILTLSGGNWDDSATVSYTTGYIRLYSWCQNLLFGDVQDVAQGWLCTFPVYATGSGVVSIASKVALYGTAQVFAIAALPWGSGSDLLVRLSYKVYDASIGQFSPETFSYEYSLSATGSPYPDQKDHSWNEDHDITGSFNAIATHYYEVYIYFTVATHGYGATGFGSAHTDFKDTHYALVRYVSMSGPLGNPPPSGGGCPYLNVYDGSQWACEGLLDIHTGYNGTDLTVSHVLANAPQAVDGRYLLRLTEHWSTYSHIDQAKLYATLSNGKTIQLPLVSAMHTQLGNVLPQLLRDDNRDVVILGAKWNNGTSQSIDLQFQAIPPSTHAVSFTFVIDGYNPIPTY